MKLSIAFREWLAGLNENRQILSLLPSELDTYIGTYIKLVKKSTPNGLEDYEPDSLTSIHRAIDRYLRENNYGYSLLTSPEFSVSKKILECRRKELKSLGKGNKPNQAEPLTPQQEDRLWETGQLGDNNARQLQNTVWWFNAKLLGFRGCDEARQIQWGDLELKMDENSLEYLEWNERTSKTRQGQPNGLRPFQPKIFENKENPPRCAIKHYKKYASSRSTKMCQPDSPFYLTVRPTPGIKDDKVVWYKDIAMGEKLLQNIVKDLCKGANIIGKFTNHSVRKTMCTNLMQAGVPPTMIMQLSGHKNVQSINNYAKASKDQQQAMCNILQNPTKRVTSENFNLPQQGMQDSEANSSRMIAYPSSNDTVSNQLIQTGRPGLSISNALAAQKSQGYIRSTAPFAGAQISGGTFNLTINHTYPNSRKRIRVIDSVSD